MHQARPRHRMVHLATRTSGRSPQSPHKAESATVVLRSDRATFIVRPHWELMTLLRPTLAVPSSESGDFLTVRQSRVTRWGNRKPDMANGPRPKWGDRDVYRIA